MNRTGPGLGGRRQRAPGVLGVEAGALAARGRPDDGRPAVRPVDAATARPPHGSGADPRDVAGDVEGGSLLVLGDATLEEVLLLLDVHHLGQPGQRILHAGGERGEAAAFQAAIGDVVDVGEELIDGEADGGEIAIHFGNAGDDGFGLLLLNPMPRARNQSQKAEILTGLLLHFLKCARGLVNAPIGCP